ncbi:site-2 protease family protein [Streptococcus agalactiae]|uniref:site-2 protease family protein n=1 Tax=Streptococcus agalactiae TaxID=1311 RepID=UPI000810B745|nr:site-2 protease family protein [Streptococcus agalactiae]OCM55796.1 peptidase [Streptococcus agalactiae]
MSKNLKTSEYQNYEIFGEDDLYIIKDKVRKKYYKLDYSDVLSMGVIFKDREEKISNFNYIFFVCSIIALEIVNVLILFYSHEEVVGITRDDFIKYLLIYFPFFIYFHELGHITFFKYFGRRVDKIGFKLNYIFPSFYVRMNDTYMLSKKEKIVVHLGGIFFSLILNNIMFTLGVCLKCTILIYLAKYMAIDILYNSIPLMNSDGYKVIIATRGVLEAKSFNENSMLVKVIKLCNIIFTRGAS